MLQLSCFIIAKNEEKNIALAISSVKNLASEIIVIDSGSTDRTIEIANSLGATIIHNEWPGYLEQKIYGESICKNKWILNIDADEELTSELQEEIDFILKANLLEHYNAYALKITILHRNDKKPRMFAPVNQVIRLYNKEYASFTNNKGDSTHDSIKFTSDELAKIFTLENPVMHRSVVSIEHAVRKANFYSSEQATALIKKQRKISNIRVIGEFFWWFIKAFFVRRYFVFGVDGLVDSMIFAFARFLRLAKLRELNIQNNNSNLNHYKD